MNLNDIERFKQIDRENMIAHIDGLPDQLAAAWALGQALPLPEWEGINKVLVAGVGGSAIGADLLAAYLGPIGKAPVILHRDYELPAWAKTGDTLVICSSHSGNTEETVSAFKMAQAHGCRILAVSTGGALAQLARGYEHAALWTFDYPSQPRAAVGYSFALLLAAYARLGFLDDPSAEVADAVSAMKTQQEMLFSHVPDIKNSSKRMAGQFYGRWITVFGAGIMAPVARRWKAQINEVAKAQAGFELLPEADHNTLQGVTQPEESFGKTMVIFLRSPLNHERNQLRDEFTRVSMMVEGMNTDFIMASGKTRLAHMWTVLHYGDYTAYYLAMAYGLDPTPVPMLVELKEKMSAAD
jgi:glucose/mannose-6-phosphate isomerase